MNWFYRGIRGNMNHQPKPNDAVISYCGRYRYALWRTWDSTLHQVTFILLNPSTADAIKNDPTIRRCIGFAKIWGYGSIAIGNLFAYRATSPSVMKEAVDAVGPDNPSWLMTLLENDLCVAGWGTHGSWLDMDKWACQKYPGRFQCLGVTLNGHPKHPLYLPMKAELIPFQVRA